MTAVEQLLYMLDEAFEGNASHSLLANLSSLSPDEWSWLPPGGTRTARDIVQHVGGCKLVYENYAFGDATLTWDDPLADGAGALECIESAVQWLREGQARLRRSVAALDGSGLLQPRMTNWGEPAETRWIIAVMVQHDLYHAGEINHIRSVRRQDDRWEYDRDRD